MNYIYHYCSITRLKNGGNTHCSGVLITSEMIDSNESYASAFLVICRKVKVIPADTIITSLSLLNPPKP